MTYTRKTRIRPLLLEPSKLAQKVLENARHSESRHLRLPQALWERVRKVAHKDRRTCANMVEVLLEEALDMREKGVSVP